LLEGFKEEMEEPRMSNSVSPFTRYLSCFLSFSSAKPENIRGNRKDYV